MSCVLQAGCQTIFIFPYNSHLHEISLVNNTWLAIIFPTLLRNLTFTYMRFLWSRTHDIYMHAITVQKFEISLVNMLLHFLCCSITDVFLQYYTLVDPNLWKGGKNELWHCIVWVGKVRPKRSQPAENSCSSHICICDPVCEKGSYSLS